MDEYFVCEGCNSRRHISQLKKRNTMPGDYCPACASEDKCAACGEMYPQSCLLYKEDIQNYVCHNCQFDYRLVARYINPLQPVQQINRKAA